MSTLADRLAAALEPLAAETKSALAKLLLAGVPKAAPKARKPSLLLDTRTVAECWLAGETVDVRNRLIARAEKQGVSLDPGDVRGRVRGADGSYMRDDAAAKAGAVRFARARAMERALPSVAMPGWRMCQACRAKPRSWRL